MLKIWVQRRVSRIVINTIYLSYKRFKGHIKYCNYELRLDTKNYCRVLIYLCKYPNVSKLLRAYLLIHKLIKNKAEYIIIGNVVKYGLIFLYFCAFDACATHPFNHTDSPKRHCLNLCSLITWQ